MLSCPFTRLFVPCFRYILEVFTHTTKSVGSLYGDGTRQGSDEQTHGLSREKRTKHRDVDEKAFFP